MTARQTLLAAFLLAASARAFAIDCNHASTRIDTAVCQNPDLTHLDAQLNQLYADLPRQIAARARPVLRDQQRTWLARRNSTCATADPACLTAQFHLRIDELIALTASCNALDGPMDESLADMTPLIVRGRWKATALFDPSAHSKPSPDDLQRSLAHAMLPALGGTIDTAPGKVCLAQQSCSNMGWFHYTLRTWDKGQRIGDDLKLPQTTALLVSSGGMRYPGYTLIPRPDKTLLAVFPLCGPNDSNCRQVAEVLTPASPDASFPTHP